jgi:predicted Zn finger-like uncharacterized protein
MIVRCENCNSAFAVRDEKVSNKKFAFTCPKCTHENIVDNKGAALQEKLETALAFGSDAGEKPPVAVGTATADLDAGGDDLFLDEGASAPDGGSTAEFAFDEGDLSGGKSLDQEKDGDSLEAELDLATEEFAVEDEDESLTLDDLDDTSALETGKDDSLDIGAEIDGLDALDDIPVYNDSDLESKTEVKTSSLDLAEEDLLADFEPVDLDAEPSQAPGRGRDRADDFFEAGTAAGDIKTEDVYSKVEEEDEAITIDLDSLEIDLEEEDTGRAAKKTFADNEDETTLDLETLDIELDEADTISGGEMPEDSGDMDFIEEEPVSGSRDEDLTLDLDSLDIQLDESEEFKKGEDVDDDEKITLEDAGLTLEELTADELTNATAEVAGSDDEDIKLSIDDIDPSLSVDTIEKELREADRIIGSKKFSTDLDLADFEEDLPDIDLDSFDDDGASSSSADRGRRRDVKDDYLDEDMIDIDFDDDRAGAALGTRGMVSDSVPGGSVNFSVDYSLKYSRLYALLRLTQIFTLGLIPHFLVLALYSVLSLILGFINHIVVMTTREAVEDFADIQENTIRHYLAIAASAVGIVDEMPLFAGRENLDHALQMNVTQPYRRSRILALLRLSLAGIVAAVLPHIVIIGILAAVIPLVCLMGLLSVIATGRWPYFLFDFLVRYYRYTARVLAYVAGIVDRYPTFRFD